MTLDNTPGPEGSSPSPSGATGDTASGSHLTLPSSRKSAAPGGRVVVKLSSVAKRAAPLAPGENRPAEETGFAPLPGAAGKAPGGPLPAKEAPGTAQKRLAPPLASRTEVKLPPKTGALPKLTGKMPAPAPAKEGVEDEAPPPLPGQRPRREKKKSVLPSFLQALFPSARRPLPPVRPEAKDVPAPKAADNLQSLDDYQRTQAPPPPAVVAPAPASAPEETVPAAKEPVLNARPLEATRSSPALAIAPPMADNAVAPPVEKHRLPPPLAESRREEPRPEEAFAPLPPAPAPAERAQVSPGIKIGAPLSELPAPESSPAAHQPPPLPPAVVPALAAAAASLVPALVAEEILTRSKVEEAAPPIAPEQNLPVAEPVPPTAPPAAIAGVSEPPLEEFKPMPAFPPEAEAPPLVPAPAEAAVAPVVDVPPDLPSATLSTAPAGPMAEAAPVAPVADPAPAVAAEPSFITTLPPSGEAPQPQVREPLPPVPAMRLGPPRRKLKRPSEWVKKPEEKVPPVVPTPEPPAPDGFAPVPTIVPVPAFASTTLPSRAAMAPPREMPAPLPPVKGGGLPPSAAAARPGPAAPKTPTVRTARARKRRLVGTIIFWVIFIGLILPALYFAGIRSGSETRVEGQVIPPPGTTLNNEVWIVTDFRDQAFSVADDLASERAPKLQEIQERQDHVQRAQADIAAREERIRLLQEQVQAAKDQIDSVIKGAHDAAQKVWDGPGADLEGDYQTRLNDLRDRIAARARSLHLDYQPDKTYNSPEVWANAYRLALYQTPPGVDNVKEHQWIEDQLKAWRDYTKTVDDRQQQLRQQAAQIQLSPTPKITELNGQVEDLQHRIDSTQSEEDPIKMELQQAQADLLQSQSAEAGLDAKYYQQLYALPEQNITKRLPVAPNGRFTWSEMERDSAFAEGENVHDYWIFARAVRADGRQYWALARFSITRNTTLPLVIEPDAFISTKSILRPDLPADEQQQ